MEQLKQLLRQQNELLREQNRLLKERIQQLQAEIQLEKQQDKLFDLSGICLVCPPLDLLCRRAIHTKEDFRKWLTSGGHPDKGGSVEECQTVLRLAQMRGWIH